MIVTQYKTFEICNSADKVKNHCSAEYKNL